MVRGRYRTEPTSLVSPPTHARLHLPPPGLGACVHLGVERDTRGVQLDDAQRFNYYPATPLPLISWIFHGELHMVSQPTTAKEPSLLAPALPRVVFSGPHRKPSASWSPGPVHALSVSFYPEALSSLFGIGVEPFLDRIAPLEEVVGGELLEQLLAIGEADGRAPYPQVEALLRPLWQGAHGHRTLPTMRGWVQSMALRAAFSRTGAGLRRAQRHFRDWTGQSHRDLQLFVRTERAMAQASAWPQDEPPDLAALASESGFADQSHLGREVRRVTGLSPGLLGERMRTDEAFWFYRLLSEHLRDPTGPGTR